MQVSELAIHPLKSGRRLRVDSITLDAQGPVHDRRWMLVDASGRFVTQRTHPALCRVTALPEGDGLRLSAPGMPALALAAPLSETLTVEVWADRVRAQAMGPAADAWCSAFLGMPVRLVAMPASSRRAVDAAWAGPGHLTAFSDGFPLLVVTQSSLDYLNRQLAVPVDWERFRPNVVIAGDLPPHAEDGWRRIRIGEGEEAVELELVKPCSRCVIPSIDPVTAVKDGQILTVLQRYRRFADGRSYLGQNAVVASAGVPGLLRLGAPVCVIERAEKPAMPSPVV